MQAIPLATFIAAGTPGPDLGRYFSAVGLLLAVLIVLAWGIKSLAAKGVGLRGGKRGLAVVEVLSLGGRRQIAVVRCYDRTFALGLGEKEVNLVAELDPVEVPVATPETGGDADLEIKEGPESEPERTLKPQAARDPFAALIERAQDRIAGKKLERPPTTSVKELNR